MACLLGALGGTLFAPSAPAQDDAHVRKSVSAALGWLVRHQSEDGSWGAKGFTGRCRPPASCAGLGEPELDIGVTALSILAFRRAGHDRTSAELFGGVRAGDVVSNGLRWLAGQGNENGLWAGKSAKYMYNHALATQAFVLAAAEDGPVSRALAQKAVDVLVNAQNPGSAWRYTVRPGDSDTSVAGWAMAALAEARRLGFTTPGSVDAGVRRWVADVTNEDFRVGYVERGTGKIAIQGKNDQFDHNEALTAIGICLRKETDPESWRRGKAVDGGVKLLMANLPVWKAEKIDYYYWYHGTRALSLATGAGGRTWNEWSGAVRKALVMNQAPESAGCAAGSWTEKDRWSFEGGRVYGTAINVLTLALLAPPAAPAAEKAGPGKPAPAVAPTQEEAVALLQKATNYEKNGLTAKARDLYQEILDKHPDSAAAPKARERLKALPP